MRPNVKTPPGKGGVKGKAGQASNLKAHRNAQGATAACQCRINPGCLVCRRWAKTINGIDARRAESLRRQSMGDLMRAGA